MPMILESATDLELVQAYANSNSQEAYQALVRRHARLVESVCRRCLGAGHPWLDDASQAVFLILASKAATIRRGESVSSWLHGTAMRVCAQVRRREERRKRREARAELNANGPGGSGRASDAAQLLDSAIASLRRGQRDVILTHYLTGKSHAEVARELGINVGAVKMRGHEALEHLRSFYRRQGIMLPIAALTALFSAECSASAPASQSSFVLGAASSKASALALNTMQGIASVKIGFAVCISLFLLGSAAVLIDHFATPVPDHRPPPSSSAERGPLKDLPSAPGPHMAKIAALEDNTWMRLDSPTPDPKWGTARGRTWGGRAFAYAPDLEGAYFFGEGPHGFVKPDGYLMDDLWVYDVNGNRWIAAHPGTDTKTFSQRVKAKEFLIDEEGLFVDKDGQPIPVHTMLQACDLLTYDIDAKRFVFFPQATPSPGGYGLNRYFLGGLQDMEEGLKLIEAQRAVKPSVTLSPWSFNSVTGKFEVHSINSSTDADSLPYFQYIRSRKQYILCGERGVAWYDPSTREWTTENDQGPRPPGYDHGGCYDEKRERIYLGRGEGDENGRWYVYDINAKRWIRPDSNGSPPPYFATNTSSVFYDLANDVMTIFQYHEGKVYTYDPTTDTWSSQPIPAAMLQSVGSASYSAFYDPKVNAYFCYAAASGDDNGVMWVYRYKNR